MRRALFAVVLGPFLFVPAAFGQTARFVAQEIDAHVGNVCYALAVADVSGDGKLDIIAGGRATHNVKIYWNRKK